MVIRNGLSLYKSEVIVTTEQASANIEIAFQGDAGSS